MFNPTSLLILTLSLFSLQARANAHNHLHTPHLVARETFDVTFDAAYYASGTTNETIHLDESVPTGQIGPLGRYKYYVDSKAGIVCSILETEGVAKWDETSGGAASIREKEYGRNPKRLRFPSGSSKTQRHGLDVLTYSGCSKFDNLTSSLKASDMADFDLQDLSSVSDFYAEIKVAEPKKFRLSGPLVKSELIVKPPKRFTSYWTSSANWTGVLNKDGQPNPGPEGAVSRWEFKINSKLEIICYNITVSGIVGDYYNAGRTATHLGYPNGWGASAYPRITFPNPAGNSMEDKSMRTSASCIKGPFATGRIENGVDSGSQSGFTLKKFENDPSLFFVDLHTYGFEVGDVRGNLTRVEKF